MNQLSDRDDDFFTISCNPGDVRSILEDEYNIVREIHDDFGVGEIFDIISGDLSQKSFAEYFIEFLQRTGRTENKITDSKDYTSLCIKTFSNSGMIGMPDIFSEKGQLITREMVRKNASNRFKGIMPARKNIFLLSMAFSFSCSELSELLTVAVGDKDVNFKNPDEFIIYWILGNNKVYSYALELKQRALNNMIRYHLRKQ